MKKIESGRSMVEMLGVLAIIGVLSVGGIAGYTMAMNKYRANEIAAQAAQCGMLSIAKSSTATTYTGGDCTDLGMTLDSNVKSMVSSGINGDTVTVTVTVKSGKTGIKTALDGLKGATSGFILATAIEGTTT